MSIRPLALLAVVGLATSAHAQTDIPWVAGNGNWSLAANWMGGTIPDNATERAIISAAGMYTVSIDSTYTVGGLVIPNSLALVQLNDARILAIGGASPIIDQTGTFIVNSSGGGNGTLVQFNASGVIQGSGHLVLNASPNLDTAYLQTSGAAVITNAAGHTIRGTGNIYGNLTNEGLITADVNARTLQFLSAPKTNNNLISASGGGTIQLSTVTLTQSGSGILRAETGSAVNLVNATVDGGTIESQGTGVVRVVSGNAAFTGIPLVQGDLHITDGRVLTVAGGLINNGVIAVNPVSGGNGTVFQLNAAGTLAGTGDLVLSASANLDTAYIQTAGAGTVLTNGANHRILGTGNIHGAVTNNGVISADVTGRTLQLLAAPKTNNNVISAVNGATLQVGATTVTQSSTGRLVADGGTLNFVNATLTGGEIEVLNSGLAQVVGGNAVFNSLAGLSGSLNVTDGRTLSVTGGLPHTGTITVNPTAGGNGTVIQFNNSGAFSDVGEVVLNASGNLDTAYLQTSGVGTVMTNGAGHLIRGTGNIHASFANSGEVRADRTGLTLQFLSAAKTNDNILTAVNGATLQFSSVTTSQGANGRIIANGGNVNLVNATVNGGRLQAINGGVVRVINGNAALNDVAGVDGPFEVTDARTLTVSGGLPHTGTITINPTAGGNGTVIHFSSNGAFSGGGDVDLNASGNLDTAYLNTSGGVVMTNAADHLIHGTGNLFAALTNNGEVRADRSTRTLQLLSGPKTNNNLMTAVSGGILQLNGFVLTQGPSGRLVADNATVNLINATVNGGEVQSLNTGIVQVVGGNSTFNNVANISGSLHVTDARVLSVTGNLVHTGTITVNPLAGGNGTVIQFNSASSMTGPGTVLLNASGNLDTAYINSSQPVINDVGHTLAGRGHIYGNFTNNGIISPGSDAGDRTNLLRRVGNYTCGPTSQVVVDIGGNVQGDTYDWLHATGTMSVDGTMVVRLAPGYIPPRNTVFTLVSGNTRVGQFSSVTLPTLPATLGYPRVEYTNNAVRVRVPLCPTDWNAMDGINSQDFFDFLNDFFAGTGDFNFDGFINSQDFFDFLTSFFGGCEG